jgi:hypothetical protein
MWVLRRYTSCGTGKLGNLGDFGFCQYSLKIVLGNSFEANENWNPDWDSSLNLRINTQIDVCFHFFSELKVLFDGDQ